MTPVPDDTERLLAETGWVHDLARRLVAGGDRADDVAQETLVRALRRPLGPIDNLRGWLAAVAQSVARRFHRDDQRRARAFAQLPERGPAESAAAVFERTQRQRDVMTAVLALAEPYRSAVLLRFQAGLGYAAIAAQLGVPIETVRTRIKRGLQQLRERLDAQHGSTAAWAGPILGVGWQLAAPATAAVGMQAGAALVAAGLVLVAVVGWVGRDVAEWPAPAQADLATVSLAGVDQEPAAPSALPGDPLPPVRIAAGPNPATGMERAAEPAASLDLGISFGSVRGVVIDAVGGFPLAAATLCVPRMAVTFTGEADLRTEYEVAQRRFAVGADGSFQLDEVPLGPFAELVVECEGYAARQLALTEFATTAPSAGASSVLDVGPVALLRGEPIRGRVVALDGASPVGDAVLSLGVAATLVRWQRLGEARPDGTFAFSIHVAGAGATQILSARSAAGDGWCEVPAVLPPGGLTIVLRPRATLVCAVVDDGGQPVAAAVVLVTAPQAPFQDRPRIVENGTLAPRLHDFGRTALDGTARLAAITLGEVGNRSSRHLLTVTAPGHRAERRPIELAPGDNEVRVVLQRGALAAVRGVVVTSAGLPIPAVEVRCETTTVVTDAEGTFAVDAVDFTSAERELRVDAPGYVALRLPLSANERHGDVELRIVLQPGAPVVGVVRDQHGDPVAGARIEYRRDARIVTTTAADGTFELPALPLGIVPLRCSPPSLALQFAGSVDVDVPADARDSLTLTLSRQR